MGLSNFLFTGSYLNISRFVFSKDIKHISCVLNIYSNDKSQFTIRDMYLSGHRKVLGVHHTITMPPINPKHEDAYVLQGDLQGVWKNYPNHIASWDAFRKDWNYWQVQSRWPDVLYLEATKQYANLINGEFIFCACYDDERIWNKFFSSDVLNDSNHIKQFYLYLKSLDAFKHCVDC